MLFCIAHISNGVCQSVVVSAKNEEIAEKYFREKMLGREFIGIREATREEIVRYPGIRVPDNYGLDKVHKEMKTRMGFRDFEGSVRRLGGIWAGEDVYFSQFRDGYSAAYQPEYPERSGRDSVIAYDWLKDAWSLNGGKPFIEACIAGEVSVDDLDAYVEFWHEHETGNKLHEFLGISREEYGRWLKTDDDSFIRAILEERKSGKTVDEVLVQANARSIVLQGPGARDQGPGKVSPEGDNLKW